MHQIEFVLGEFEPRSRGDISCVDAEKWPVFPGNQIGKGSAIKQQVVVILSREVTPAEFR
jgi:hypothetical protein